MLTKKSLPFIGFIFILSLLLSYSMNQFFEIALTTFDGIDSLRNLFFVIVIIFLLLSVTGILYLLVSLRSRWIATFVSALGFFIGLNIQEFTLQHFLVSILLTVIFTLGIYYFDARLSMNYRNMIEPDFSAAIQHSAGGFILFFSILVATNFYFFNQNAESRDVLIQRGLSLIIDPVARVAHEDTLRVLETISPDFKRLIGPAEAQKVNEEAVEVVRNIFAEQMKQYTTIILNVITLLIFLSLFSVFKLAKLLIGPLVTLLILFLKEIGYIYEEKETIEITRYKI